MNIVSYIMYIRYTYIRRVFDISSPIIYVYKDPGTQTSILKTSVNITPIVPKVAFGDLNHAQSRAISRSQRSDPRRSLRARRDYKIVG